MSVEVEPMPSVDKPASVALHRANRATLCLPHAEMPATDDPVTTRGDEQIARSPQSGGQQVHDSADHSGRPLTPVRTEASAPSEAKIKMLIPAIARAIRT